MTISGLIGRQRFERKLSAILFDPFGNGMVVLAAMSRCVADSLEITRRRCAICFQLDARQRQPHAAGIDEPFVSDGDSCISSSRARSHSPCSHSARPSRDFRSRIWPLLQEAFEGLLCLSWLSQLLQLNACQSESPCG